MHEKNLKTIKTYTIICQLRFLTRTEGEMLDNRLTHYVVNSQAVPQWKCSRGQQTTKRAYGDSTLKYHTDLFDEEGDIKTSEWIEYLEAKEMPSVTERNL